jgi:hypothetical protein
MTARTAGGLAAGISLSEEKTPAQDRQRYMLSGMIVA